MTARCQPEKTLINEARQIKYYELFTLKKKFLKEIQQLDYLYEVRVILTVLFSYFRINCYNALNAQSPFGGFKMSGNGREM